MSKSDKLHASGGSINDHLAPERRTEDQHPAAHSATRLDARFPLERELPLPMELRRVEYPVASESFRGFGINE